MTDSLRDRVNNDIAKRLIRQRAGDISANAELATFRTISRYPLGDSPQAWRTIIELCRSRTVRDDVSVAERAVAAALEISGHEAAAFRRRSARSLEDSRVRLGVAVRRASNNTQAKAGISRSWDRMMTATSSVEVIDHLLMLTRLLHENGQVLDHGSLVLDLIAFNNPAKTNVIRRRWMLDAIPNTTKD